MNIQSFPIMEVHPYEKNPRKNDAAVESVAASIKQFGFLVPLVIDRNHIVVTGHTRLKAAKKLGLKSVPCVIADELTADQIKAFRLADNKVGEISEWDADLLAVELNDLAIDMSAFGFEVITADEFGKDFSLDGGGKKPFQQISLTLQDDQAALLHAAIAHVYASDEVNETFGNENKNGNGIYEVVRQWAVQKKLI